MGNFEIETSNFEKYSYRNCEFRSRTPKFQKKNKIRRRSTRTGEAKEESEVVEVEGEVRKDTRTGEPKEESEVAEVEGEMRK